ncbi:GCN5-related N-acetyltransferase [Actinobacteria bacterium OK074]|nr:GCN5-related N-acetyltransferase [Actinobacteria bacterium OK074]
MDVILRLPDGIKTFTRIARPDDFPAIQELHARCSAESRALRYQAGKPGLTRREWNHLSGRDSGITLVTSVSGFPAGFVAMTNLMRTPMAGVSEIALLVEDAWQSRGLGSALAVHTLGIARHQGQRTLAATVSTRNTRAVRLLRRLGATSPPFTGAAELDMTVLITAGAGRRPAE